MSDLAGIAFASLAGFLLGAFYFGGLWWTVRKAMASKGPALWFMTSLVLRTSIVITGFFFVSGDDWRRWLAALAGFVLARLVVIRLTRTESQSMPAGREAGNAP